MNILIVQPMSYLGRGGALKANRALMEAFAARGHASRAAVAITEYGPDPQARLRAELAAQKLPIIADSPEEIVFNAYGVEVHAVTDPPQLFAQMVTQMRECGPTWTLVSEDPTFTLL